jgi:uncharacterized membrane protein YdjX (TVP38/TMEM64 family)
LRAVFEAAKFAFMSKMRRALYIQVGGAVFAVALLFCASRFLPIADWLAQLQLRVMHLGVWSAMWYPLLYAGCNVLLLPGGLLGVGGGFFFGLWWGFFIVLIGNVSGAAISFILSRWLGRRWIQQAVLHNPTLQALEPAVAREGWKIILLSQLNPLFPTSLLNYLYGLTTIRFRTCILWVAIGQAPGLFLYAYIGTLGQLGLNLLLGKSHPRTIEYFVWVGGLAISIVIVFLIGRISLRLIQEAEEGVANGGEHPTAELHTDRTLPPNGSAPHQPTLKLRTDAKLVS